MISLNSDAQIARFGGPAAGLNNRCQCHAASFYCYHTEIGPRGGGGIALKLSKSAGWYFWVYAAGLGCQAEIAHVACPKPLGEIGFGT